MRLAVGLRLDEASAAGLRRLWRLAAAFDPAGEVWRAGAPHLTLAVAGAPDDIPALLAGMRMLAAEVPPFTLQAHPLAMFPDGSLALLPTATASLLAFHRRALGALPLREIAPRYQPDAWLPHVSLAKGLSDPLPLLARLREGFEPFPLRCDRLAAHLFRPLRDIGEARLGGG